MKRISLISAVLLAALSAGWMGCEAPAPKTAPGSIGGTIAGLDAGTEVVLRSFSNGNLVNVASTILDSAGGFTLTPSQAFDPRVSSIACRTCAPPLVLITDQTEGVTVEATARAGENYMVDASIAGSPESVTIAEYYGAIMPLQQRIKQAERDTRTLSGDKRPRPRKP